MSGSGPGSSRAWSLAASTGALPCWSRFASLAMVCSDAASFGEGVASSTRCRSASIQGISDRCRSGGKGGAVSGGVSGPFFAMVTRVVGDEATRSGRLRVGLTEPVVGGDASASGARAAPLSVAGVARRTEEAGTVGDGVISTGSVASATLTSGLEEAAAVFG
jgi:hypothetical protein